MAYTFNPFTGTFDNAPSTLKGDSAYSTLCAISGDLVTYDYLHDGFLPLSGGTITGNLSVEGNFEVGSLLPVTMAVIQDRVGINTETPNEELTVVGDVSASSVIYASGGNSNIWNESYSLIQSNSASWVSDSTADTEVRALTSGWIGGNDAYTNLVANSAAYLSAVDLSFLSVSANWDSVYNTVQSNSATNWNYQGTDIKALTSNWESTYTTFRDASSTFLTSETDSQTLSFDETTKDLTISNGNTVSLSSFNGASGNYLPLSGGTVTGNLSVEGNFEVGPSSGSTTLFISGDRVGINTETPNEELTIVGDISASNIIYADGGNSVSWNEVFTSYSSNSSTFLTSETDSQTLSFDEGTKDLTISNGNTVSLSALVDTSGTIDVARMPAFSGDITTVAGSTSATVVAIQGEPISTQSPSTGQILQWSGTSWTPGSIPTGGSGGGGLSYYFNFETEAQSPTTNLSATPNTPKELGTTGTVLSSSYTTGHLSQTNYDLVCGFVSVSGNPNTTVIPSGLWDFNIWASSNSTVTNQMMLRLFVYKYDGVNHPTLLAQSDDIYLYDPSVPAQYIGSVVFPQTNILLTDRIYIEIRAKSTQNNRHVTVYFGNGTPSHVHTTLPSVGGTGLVKVVNGVYQTPASLLVDADVASNANIAQTKISGLPDLASQSSSTYTTVNSNSADWSSVYSTVQSNSATTWNYQGTDLKALSGNWQTTYLASSAYVVSNPTGITGASALTKLIQITQAGYNAIITPSSDTLYVIVG